MKICFVGLDNLPVLAREFNQHGIGGEQVQQTLLAKALARRGHNVSMIVYDYGQRAVAEWDGVVAYRSFRQTAGIPVLRFFYPRFTKTWRALRKANSDVYYLSSAGMHLGLVALFCRLYNRKLVFRVAHNTDCDPNALLIKYYRDKKAYEYGLARTDLILVQTVKQQHDMMANYRMPSTVAQMLVREPADEVMRDVDVLWVNNLRHFKRPDLFISLAKRLPNLQFCMIGGEQTDSRDLFEKISQQAALLPNVTFCGRVPYQEIDKNYARARVFINTSDSEGFPNSYLQAWVHGTPTVAFFDPDNIIKSCGLGYIVQSLDEMANKVCELLANGQVWKEKSDRCQQYMKRYYSDDDVLSPYLTGIQGLLK